MKDFGKGFIIFIIIVLIVIGATFGHVFLLRPYLDLRREAIQSSQQYTESKQSMLMELADDYYKAEEEAHKAYLLERIQMEAERIPYEELPETIKKIIRSNN